MRRPVNTSFRVTRNSGRYCIIYCNSCGMFWRPTLWTADCGRCQPVLLQKCAGLPARPSEPAAKRILVRFAVADLGFGKGGCPIHQKGTPKRAKPPTCAPKACAGGGSGGLPRKFENLDTLIHFSGISGFQRITICMIECAFMTKRAP